MDVAVSDVSGDNAVNSVSMDAEVNSAIVNVVGCISMDVTV